MNEKDNSQGVALCPQCMSVLEFFSDRCPWCQHVFEGREAIKILSMLAETGVGPENLLDQVKYADEDMVKKLLEEMRENFEKGSQGAKIVSLVILQQFGDAEAIPVESLVKAFRHAGKPVKAEIIKTLARSNSKKALEAMMQLQERETSPDVLARFSQWGDMALSTHEEELSKADIILADLIDIGARGSYVPPTQSIPPPLPGEVRPLDAAAAPFTPIQPVQPPSPGGSGSGRLEVQQISLVTRAPRQPGSAGLFLGLFGIVCAGAAVFLLLYLLDFRIPGLMGARRFMQTVSKGQGAGAGEDFVLPGAGTGEEAPMDDDGGTEEGGAAAMGAQAAAAKKLDFLVSASSEHRKYPAENVKDGDPATVWQEGRGLKAAGQTLTLTFGGPVLVERIDFVTGYDDPDGPRGDMFPLNNRLKKASLRFSDGSTTEIEFEDARGVHEKKLVPPLETSSLDVTVLDSYRGSWFNDNAVAEIAVYGFSDK